MFRGRDTMSNKNKVIVRIMGQEYTMVGNESREYMQRIANYVDDKMMDIAKNTKKLSTAMVAVLTALNIGDEYFKLKKQLNELEKAAMLPLKELEQTKNQLAVTKSELETKDFEFEEIIRKMEQDKNTTSKDELLKDELLEEIEGLKQQLSTKDVEFEKMIKENDDLQNKLFNSQIKYVQARKELENFIEAFESEKK